MQYQRELEPFIEAFLYLCQRFTKERTSERIERIKQEHPSIPNTYWDLCFKITALEQKLDEEFISDDLMQEYFTPLKTKDSVTGIEVFSIGAILLRMPEDGPAPKTIDDLIAYYNSASTTSKFRHFGGVLSAVWECQTEIKDLSELVTVIDAIIALPEDKWRIIDAVTDPIRHLERLRPLVTGITERIREAVPDFTELIDKCYNLICSSNKTMMDSLIKLDDDLPYERVTVMPSIFYFDLYSRGLYENNKMLIILGVFVYNVFMPKSDRPNEDMFVYVLKTLSDATRLRVLHSLCDEYSYGQRLAEQYNSTPNALYYHLDKLLSCGLVEMKETEYRTLYTMNKRAVYKNLTDLRDYLVNGWKPEDGEEQ